MSQRSHEQVAPQTGLAIVWKIWSEFPVQLCKNMEIMNRRLELPFFLVIVQREFLGAIIWVFQLLLEYSCFGQQLKADNCFFVCLFVLSYSDLA